MDGYRHLLVEQPETAILRVSLNRPQVLNALNVETLEELLRVFQVEARASQIRCVILTGIGRAFCTGQDLEERRPVAEGKQTISLQASLEKRYNPLVTAIRELPCPVIAALNGVAVGAGAGLALACDIRLASSDAGLMLSFVKVGLSLDSGASFTLPRLVGMGRAFEIAALGDRINANEGERIGLFNHVYPAETLAEEALKMARRFAAGPPLALARIKRELYFAGNSDLPAALQFEAEQQEEAVKNREYPEGLRAFFEKRPPDFSR